MLLFHTRLESAQSELKEKEKASKDSEHTYAKDKATCDAIQKDSDKIEVNCVSTYVYCCLDRFVPRLPLTCGGSLG